MQILRNKNLNKHKKKIYNFTHFKKTHIYQPHSCFQSDRHNDTFRSMCGEKIPCNRNMPKHCNGAEIFENFNKNQWKLCKFLKNLMKTMQIF